MTGVGCETFRQASDDGPRLPVLGSFAGDELGELCVDSGQLGALRLGRRVERYQLLLALQ